MILSFATLDNSPDLNYRKCIKKLLILELNALADYGYWVCLSMNKKKLCLWGSVVSTGDKGKTLIPKSDPYCEWGARSLPIKSKQSRKHECLHECSGKKSLSQGSSRGGNLPKFRVSTLTDVV